MTSALDDKDLQMFRVGLREAGYVEGRDVVIEWRSANGDYALLPKMAADLVDRRVEVIVVETTRATQILKRTTTTIPIVMAAVGDPVRSGLVASLAHPGGNVTGLTLLAAELGAKRLELLKQALPRVNRVAVLWNPDTPWHRKANADLEAASAALSLKLSFVGARAPDDFEAAFSEIRRASAEALYMTDDGIFFAHRAPLLSLIAKAKLPASYSDKQFVYEGALMSYGPNLGDMYRRAAGYVDRILKGARPPELPISQPEKFELVVNMKTAKTLGVLIPEPILARADEVIH